MPKFKKVLVWNRIKGTKPKRYTRGHVWKRIPTPATHYSENFTKAELNCKCGCKPSRKVVRELKVLAQGLELLRKELGHPLGVLSGHRCHRHNVNVGGATRSQHVLGTAADLSVPQGRQDEYVSAATRVTMFRNGGIGIYPNGGVHVDHRNYRARWNSWGR